MSTPLTDPVWTILALAVVTYAMRAGGLLMSDLLPKGGRWAYALERLPGAVLISVWLPTAMTSGVVGLVGATAAAAAMLVTRNVLAAMVAGAGVVAAGRAVFPGLA